MNAPQSSVTATALATQARELFVTRVAEYIQTLTATLPEHLSNLLNETRDAREMQKRRDAWVAFPKVSLDWAKAVLHEWHALEGSTGNTLSSNLGGLDGLSLIEDDSVENKILASRMALRLIDKVSWDLNDLTVRMKALENIEELSKKDVLRPESLATALIEAWQSVGMAREAWPLVQDKVLDVLCEKLPGAYKEVNALLISRNVMREIDLRQMVKRTPSGASNNAGHSVLPSDEIPLDSGSGSYPHTGASGHGNYPTAASGAGHMAAGSSYVPSGAENRRKCWMFCSLPPTKQRL